MRKFRKTGICLMAAALLFTAGCASAEKTEETTAAAAETEAAGEELDDTSSIELGEYKGIEVLQGQAEVTDEEVQNEIDGIIARGTAYVAVEREAKDGDQVLMDYKGLLDGEEFTGGSAQNTTLVLGSNQFIDGFEEGLIGAKAGESRSLNLKFPEKYHSEELAGKDVVFEVDVKEVREKYVPTLDDEFVKSLDRGIETVDEFRVQLRDEILDRKNRQFADIRDTDLITRIIENSDIQCSEKRVNEMFNEQINAHMNAAASYGLDMTTYVSMLFQTTMDDFEDEIQKFSEELVKQEMVLNAIADAEKIEVNDEDITALVSLYGFKSVDEMKETGEVDEEAMRETARMRKTLDFLVDQAVVKEVSQDELIAVKQAEMEEKRQAEEAEKAAEAAEDETEAAEDEKKAE